MKNNALSWSNLAGSRLDKDALRQSLSVEAVVTHELGVRFDEFGKASCPFHDDSNPSFAVFIPDDGVERVGCWSCDWRGDVFDVIREARKCSFAEAMHVAKTLVGILPERQVRQRDELSPAELLATVKLAQRVGTQNPEPIDRLLHAKGIRAPVEWMVDQFQLGVASLAGHGTVLIPHYDSDFELVGYKVRSPRTPPIAARGSRFSSLYGVWRDTGWGRVVVCEGETDTWSAAWLADGVTAVGIPTGAVTPVRSHWLAWFAGRNVRLLFDPDEAGRSATTRWVATLEPYCNVTGIVLPNGLDLTMQPLATQEELVNGGW